MRDSIKASLLAVWAGLRAPGLWLILLLSLGAWALAYQQKQAYTLDVGGRMDDAFVFGFNDKEHNPELTYRWSADTSAIVFQGLGNEPVRISISTVGYRPSGASPALRMGVRGQTFTLQTKGSIYTDTLTVGRGDPLDPDLRLVLWSPTFSPPGDARHLGVIVNEVTVAPGEYGLAPLVIPAPATLGQMLLALLLCFLSAVVTTRLRAVALWLAGAMAVVATILVVVARPELGLLAPTLPVLCLWGLALSFAARAVLDLIVPASLPSGRFVVAAGSSALVAGFLLRYGGLIYPEFLSSDLRFHVHNVEYNVLRGRWVFTGYLPDGTPVPYPPAYYVLVAPLTWLLGSGEAEITLLLKWTASLLDACTCVGLAWGGWRLWPGRTGGLAAMSYALIPASFDLFSAGNYSNLFAQSVFNLTAIAALVFLAQDRPRRPWLWVALLSLGFALSMLGHYGVLLAGLPMLGLFALWAIAQSARRRPVGTSWWLLGSFVAGVAMSGIAYYWRYAGTIWDQLTGILQRVIAGRPGSRSTSTPAASEPQAPPLQGILPVGGKLGRLVGLVPTIFAGFGALLDLLSAPALAFVCAWMVASAFFFALDQVVGDAVRWYYLAAAGVALLAGRPLALLVARRRAASILVGLALGLILWQLLQTWVGEMIFTRYH